MRYLLVREIEITLQSVRSRLVALCTSITLASPLIPVLGVLGLLGWPCLKGRVREEKQSFLILSASVIISAVVFGLPIYCLVANPRSVSYYSTLLTKFEISHVEVYSPIISYVVLLYLAVYIAVVSLDIQHIVDTAKRARFSFFQQSVRKVTLVPLDKSTPKEVGMMDLVRTLEGLPGWMCLDDEDEPTAEPKRARKDLPGSPKAAQNADDPEIQRGHIDYVTFGANKDAKERMMDVSQLHKVGFFFRHQAERCAEQPVQTACMVIFGILRALVPRIWVTLYWGHHFVPSDPYVATMTWHGIVLTAVCGAMWLVIFNNARVGYQENVNQMKIVSAMVHLEKRHTYLKTVVAPRCKSDEEFNKLSRKLPYFTMDNVSNIKAWWLIREYAVIDTMDERMTLEITCLLVFTVMFLMVVHSVLDFVMVGKTILTSFQVLTLLDLSMLGTISLFALGTYVEMNNLMREQADILINARHGLLTPESKLMDMTDGELTLALSSGLGKSRTQSGGMGESHLAASDFLSHLSEVIRVDDFVQTMFGVEVTAYNLAQVVLGMIAGVGSSAGVLYEALIRATDGEIVENLVLAQTNLALHRWGV
jgi:hypothetical protein